MFRSIALDGPAGAGKSTVAKKVAKELGFIYIDTGAMYRACAMYFLRMGVSMEDLDTIEKHLDEIDIVLTYSEDGRQLISLNGEDVTDKIRTEEIGNGASAISVHKPVRQRMVALQQAMAKKADVIMDGRDIASAVLTDATLKVYLTAASRVRALRRYQELTAKGVECDIGDIERDIIERDYRDMHRENSPLIKVEDAIEVDSSEMNADQVADYIVCLFNRTIE